MIKKRKPKKVLILGSGALQIGWEFHIPNLFRDLNVKLKMLK